MPNPTSAKFEIHNASVYLANVIFNRFHSTSTQSVFFQLRPLTDRTAQIRTSYQYCFSQALIERKIDSDYRMRFGRVVFQRRIAKKIAP